jgi:hypothetical protein
MIPAVQTAVVHIVTNRLSADINAEISIDRVSITPFGTIRLNQFLVRDQQNDTLFYSENVRAGIDHFSLRDKHLYLGKVRFNQPMANIYQSGEHINFAFILDSLGKNRPDTIEWEYSLRGMAIQNGRIQLKLPILDNPGILTDHLLFTGLNLSADRTSRVNEPLVFEVSEFSVKEASGLQIEGFKSQGYLEDDKIVIDNLSFRTARSLFDFEAIELPIGVPDETSGYDMPFTGRINRLIIAPEDIRYYYDRFPALESPITLSGLIYGSLDNLKGREIHASFGNNTHFHSSFDISGMSNFNETFLYMDIEALETTVADLELLIAGDAPVIPESFNELETIRYKGNITGFINSLVAYGSFTSNLGNISTDIGIKIDEDKKFMFGGLLYTTDFNLGRLINAEPAMGQVSLDMEISGSRSSQTDYFIILDGNVESMEFNQYDYSNISVQGLLTHQKFDGSVRLNDPNGALDFIGEVDMSGTVPHFDFMAAIRNAQLDRLNLLPNLEEGILSVLLETNFEGDNLDDLVGEIILKEGLLFTPAASIDFDSISIRAVREGDLKRLSLHSAFADGEVTGKYLFRHFKRTFQGFMQHYLPSYVAENEATLTTTSNDFQFNLQLKKIQQLASVFIPNLDIADEGHIRGHFRSEPPELNLDVSLDHFNFNNLHTEGLELNATTNNGKGLKMVTRAGKIQFGKFVDLLNFSIHQTAANDTLTTNLFWNNWDLITNSGALYSTTEFSRDEDDNRHTKIDLLPSTVILSDTTWQINASQLNLHAQGMSVRNFRIEHDGQFILLNGFLHREEEDGLKLVFNRMNINQFLSGNDLANVSFGGTINGELALRDFYREPLLTSNLEIEQFMFNQVPYGTFSVKSNWDRELDALVVNTELNDDSHEPLKGTGLFHPKTQNVDFQFEVDSLNVGFLNPMIQKVLQDLTGTASGRMFLKGPITQPYLTGRVKLNDGRFDVGLLNSTYQLTDSVIFYPNEMRFRDMTVTDRLNKKGRFKGSIYHNGKFKEMLFNLRLDANNMVMLDTRLQDNPLYYGTVIATGFMTVTGNTDNVNLAITGRTRPNTRFFIPIESPETALESNFIRFVNKGQDNPQLQKNSNPNQEYSIDLTGAKVDMDIEVTPDAEVQIIFDERIGDILKSTGAGNIQIRIDRQGNIRFFGDYTIQQGEYLFSLQNLINKRFDINQGGTVKWQGSPYNAEIDITAVYKLRASLSDLIDPVMVNETGSSQDLQRRVLIHTNLILGDMLQQPSIRFGLEMPTLDESREALVLDYISSEEELNRQVLSLLLLNRFYTPEHLRMSDNSSSRSENAALVTTTEMLSSQISRWFSTISNDVDVGFAYRPSDNITSEEFELALSTQVFNNRVTINGNVGYGKYQANTSKMVGDFDMDVKLNPSGTLRARAYTRSNEDLIYETSPTTQGIGLSFKEEFNDFRELLKKYWNALAGKKEDE